MVACLLVQLIGNPNAASHATHASPQATTKQLQRHREAMLERGRALVARCDALLAKGVEAARAEGQLRQAQTSLRDAEMRSALGVLQDVGEGGKLRCAAALRQAHAAHTA